jgi:hypothetical protein
MVRCRAGTSLGAIAVAVTGRVLTRPVTARHRNAHGFRQAVGRFPNDRDRQHAESGLTPLNLLLASLRSRQRTGGTREPVGVVVATARRPTDASRGSSSRSPGVSDSWIPGLLDSPSKHRRAKESGGDLAVPRRCGPAFRQTFARTGGAVHHHWDSHEDYPALAASFRCTRSRKAQ